MGMFDKMSGEKIKGAGGGGNFFRDGRYLIELVKITNGESQQGEGEYVAVECCIKKVLVQFEGSNKPGELVSWVVMAKHGDVALSNLKSFIGAITGKDPNCSDPHDAKYASPADWAKAGLRAASGDGTLLAGTELNANAVTIITKKRQSKFTKVSWASASVEEEKKAA